MWIGNWSYTFRGAGVEYRYLKERFILPESLKCMINLKLYTCTLLIFKVMCS